jgi:hypothetical protein
VAGAQVALFHSYEAQLTFIAVSLMFLVPLVFAWWTMGSGRTSLGVAFGIPAAALAALCGLAFFFSATGGSSADCSTFRSAVQDAGFLPKNFSMDESALWPLDADRAAGVHESIGGDEAYIPFRTAFGDGKLAVLEFDSSYDKTPELHPLEGLIYKVPLPYLIRRAWPDETSTFAVVVRSRKSVREFWIFQATFYLLVFAYVGWQWRKSRLAAAKAATAPARTA